MYWSNYTNHKISSANLDGTGGGADLDTTGATVDAPNGVAIDPAAGKIYWANFDGNKISAANLDGTGGWTDLNTTGATVNGPAFPALLQAPLGSGSPTISESIDNELSCSEGSWAADLLGAFLYRAPASLAYQWLYDDLAITGATHKTFHPTKNGSYSCRVSATNHAGFSTQTSAARKVTNRFSFGKLKLNKKKGIATLIVKLPGAGELVLKKSKYLKGAKKSLSKAGKTKLKLKPKGKTKRKLLKKGKAKVKVKVTYTPTGGSSLTKTKKVKLKKRS